MSDYLLLQFTVYRYGL